MKQASLAMRKTVDLLKTQLFGMTDDIDEGLISTVKVDYNHQLTPLQHMSLVNQQGRRISVTPYDPSMIGAVEKELKKQGFDAYKFSKTTVVVNIPLPTQESVEKAKTQRKKIGEEAKVSIRNIRKKFRKKVDNDKRLQEATDAAIKEIDELT